MLERIARPYLLLVAALLLAGILLTGFNLLLLGWSVYALGHVGSIGAFLLVGWAYRKRMDAWAWLGLGVLVVGLVLALPQVAQIWADYFVTPTGLPMHAPADSPPIGLVAEIVTWVALAFYGLAARGARALPAGVGWVFAAAAVVGLLAAFDVIAALWWVAAVLAVTLGLLMVGASLTAVADRGAREPLTTDAPPLT
jgi:hypothetical protein